MRSVGLLPAIPLVAGTAAGIGFDLDARAAVWLLLVSFAAALLAGWRRWNRVCVAATVAGFLAAGGALGASARVEALEPSLRALLDRAIGGVAISTLGPEGDHDPIAVRMRLVEDAAVIADPGAPGSGGYVSLRAEALAIRLDGAWQPAGGGLRISIGGSAFPGRAGEWRAGRVIEAPVVFRRPARYLNDGVADFERDLALSGTTLFGSVKSALLVDVVATGSGLDEWAGRVRAGVRRAVERHVSSHDPLSGALVTAVLIGDRAGLPDEVRERLQEAGTYHVIAISGGNIAILAGLGLAVLAAATIRGRVAAVLVAAGLLAYAQVVTAGPSVWRATAMAVIFLAARILDHRAPSWQTTAVAAALMTAIRPLDVRDVGFVLTFGATGALLEGVRRSSRIVPARGPLGWVMASLAASISVEAVLMPVSAQVFSRVTVAGLLLNLAAVPLMAVVQVAGLVVVAMFALDMWGSTAQMWGPLPDRIAALAGWIAHLAAAALVDSARLLDVAPWLSFRVPPPGPLVLGAYYGAGAAVLFARRPAIRAAGAALLLLAATLILTGWRPAPRVSTDDELRITMFDAGQAESMLLQLPRGPVLLVDAGGAPFGDSLDVGARVLAPALWAKGLRSLDRMLVTHGDPDHLGGARVLAEEFRPSWLWEGIVVPGHAPMAGVRDAAARAGSQVEVLRAGREWTFGETRVRVLHPPEPDWERPRVRNDDSVVLEVRYRDVALLLTGDISAAIERTILPLLTPARLRILKVAHHGSRTSSSAELLETWRPQIALISAGRGNSFGHPTPEVLSRLDAIGAIVLRTDRHGQITIATDGRTVKTTTFVGASP